MRMLVVLMLRRIILILLSSMCLLLSFRLRLHSHHRRSVNSEQNVGIITDAKHVLDTLFCETPCEGIAPWLNTSARLRDEGVDYVDGVVYSADGRI